MAGHFLEGYRQAGLARAQVQARQARLETAGVASREGLGFDTGDGRGGRGGDRHGGRGRGRRFALLFGRHRGGGNCLRLVAGKQHQLVGRQLVAQTRGLVRLGLEGAKQAAAIGEQQRVRAQQSPEYESQQVRSSILNPSAPPHAGRPARYYRPGGSRT
ncbi:hypothetical protein C2862_23055 [Massilia sp. Mn16-1_5]|nr:hypothetical protein C2862_23055 [Massilia sp. Mn16-1_5]